MNRKKIYISVALVFFTAHFLLMGPAWAKRKSGNLRVVVVGFRSSKGKVKIGLYNTKKGYKSRGKIKSFKSATIKVKNKKARYTFKRVPYGEYTVKLYHDENGNNKLDTNLLGIPTEDYGISNNVRGKLGLPSYNRARFLFESKQKTITIKMI